MKLQKFTRQGSTAELLNTSRILSVFPAGSGSAMIYRYFSQQLQLILTESLSAVNSSLSDNRKYSMDLLVLPILSIDGAPKNYEMPVNLAAVVRGVSRSYGTLLYCEGALFGVDREMLLIQTSRTIDQIVSDQLFTFEAGSGPTSLAFNNVEVIEGNTLIEHNHDSKVMGAFIEIDGVWQAWSFHYGSGEDELSEAAKLTSVFIPFPEAKTVNLSLIF